MTAARSTSRVLFPEDLVPNLLEYCDGVTLGRAAGVCRSWSIEANKPDLWHKVIEKTQDYTIEDKRLPIKDIFRVRHITLKNLRSGRYKTSTLHLTLPGYSVLYHHVDAKTNRIALIWNGALHIFAVDTGQKVREITHLPATVSRAHPLLDSLPLHFSANYLGLTRTLAHKLILQNNLIQSIFNMQTLSFEFACTGRILHEGEGYIVTHNHFLDLEIIDSLTKEVKFSFQFGRLSFYDFKDDLGIIAHPDGQIIIFNCKECRKVCEFQLVGAQLQSPDCLKLIDRDRVVIQTNENEVRLIHTQTGETMKTLPYSLCTYPGSSIQCGSGKWIAFARGLNSVFVIDSKQGDVLKEIQIDTASIKEFFIIHNRLVIITFLTPSILVYDLASYALLNEYPFPSATHIEKESGESSLSDDQELSNIIFLKVLQGSPKYYFLDLSSGEIKQYIPQEGFSWRESYREDAVRRFSQAHLVDICYNNRTHMASESEGETTFKIQIANFLEQAPPPVAAERAPAAPASSCVIL